MFKCALAHARLCKMKKIGVFVFTEVFNRGIDHLILENPKKVRNVSPLLYIYNHLKRYIWLQKPKTQQDLMEMFLKGQP